MDEEIENFLENNNTDDLYDFLAEPTGWDYVQDVFTLLTICVGFTCDILIAVMVMRNKRMRTKTNVVLMNIAINDACFLFTNIHFLTALYEMVGASHFAYYSSCLLSTFDVIFQFNTLVFLLILVSNTLMKQTRFTTRTILIVDYVLMMVTLLCDSIVCVFVHFPTLYLISFLVFLLVVLVLIVKEINNCYKKWYRKQPLGDRTRLRLNVLRIYMATWLLSAVFYIVGNHGLRMFFYTIAANCFLSSLYILVYLVHADKFFHISLLNLMQCKEAGAYDFDATITFATEENDTNSSSTNISINTSRGEDLTNV